MSKDSIINYGKSIRSKLLNVAKKEDVFYQTILTRYFQERLLYRISQTKYRSNFYLKGGALMYAYERFAARPTLDIDFLGNNISNEGKSIMSIFREICSVPCVEDGITFDTENITSQNIIEFKDYHGIRLSIPVRMDTISQVMTMDIGFGDVVTPSPVDLDYPLLLEHLPRANILAYSIETVIAEKMHAVIDLADQNSRMKDYYDLYNLLSKEKYDNDTLQEAIIRTFENRHTTYDANTMFFRKGFVDNGQMQVKWQAFLRRITNNADLSFSDVATFIQNTLRPYWERMSHV
ncbi:MAG: nucleotidyl transferase AbiEii/AbiGii toxin family protein [Bacteroidales bacterium]|nr:nucleotidyl transferase AbiEii/AbiGii toxin family protein [Bacteroidales bacterium]